MNKTFENIDQALVWITRHTLERGEFVSPRGLETREILGLNFRLLNPRGRRVHIPSRRWNAALAVGELCWHMSGSDSLAFISYYSSNWRAFSDDGVHIRGSCYGKRIFSLDEGGISSWDRIKIQLAQDSASRRAVLSFMDASAKPSTHSKDIPCITSIQFIVRSKRLHCFTFMRSNDVIWGLCYDVFIVTMLQERLALELGLDVGWYEHYVGSMHIYEKHYGMAEAISNERPDSTQSMMRMEHVESIHAFLEAERTLREGNSTGLSMVSQLPVYWRELARPLVDLYGQKWGNAGGSAVVQSMAPTND